MMGENHFSASFPSVGIWDPTCTGMSLIIVIILIIHFQMTNNLCSLVNTWAVWEKNREERKKLPMVSILDSITRIISGLGASLSCHTTYAHLRVRVPGTTPFVHLVSCLACGTRPISVRLLSSWVPRVVFRVLEVPSKVHLESEENPKIGQISIHLVGCVLSSLPEALGIICES